MSIFRRLLMMGGKKPIAYLEFEDRRVWEICCYNWGDTKLVTPSSAFATGEIEADGSALVVCGHVFASCLAHPKRKYSNGTSPAQVNAAARTFEVELQFDSANPFSSIADGTTVIEIRQYASNTSTQVVVGTLAKEDVVLDGDNKLTITTSGTTNACQYLTVAVLANNGVKATYNFKVASTSASGIYQPVGITQKQCAAVSSLGLVFQGNKVISKFHEFQNFTGVTQLSLTFIYSTLTEITFPPSITLMNEGVFRQSTITVLNLNEGLITYCRRYTLYDCAHIEKVVIPSTVTEMGNRGMYNCGVLKDVIMLPTTPPSISSSDYWRRASSALAIYVPDESVEAYKTAQYWSALASRIKPISQLPE